MKFIRRRELIKFMFVLLSESDQKNVKDPLRVYNPQRGSKDRSSLSTHVIPAISFLLGINISSKKTPVRAPGRWKFLPLLDCHSALYKSHSSLLALGTWLCLLDLWTYCKVSHQCEQ